MIAVVRALLRMVAGRRWCFWWAAVAVAGCVWPPDIQERGSSRFPPEIARDQVYPQPDQAVTLTGAPVEFSVEGAVSDQDNDIESLQYVWFLDWPQNCAPGQCYGAFYLPGLGANKKLTINPCGFYRKYLEADEFHLLELFVTDGEVIVDVEQGRRVIGGYASVTWWLVNRLVCP